MNGEDQTYKSTTLGWRDSSSFREGLMARWSSLNSGPVFLVLITKRVSYASVLHHKCPLCHPAFTPHLLLFCCSFFVAQPWIIGERDGGDCELSLYCHGTFTVKQYADKTSTSTQEIRFNHCSPVEIIHETRPALSAAPQSAHDGLVSTGDPLHCVELSSWHHLVLRCSFLLRHPKSLFIIRHPRYVLFLVDLVCKARCWLKCYGSGLLIKTLVVGAPVLASCPRWALCAPPPWPPLPNGIGGWGILL